MNHKLNGLQPAVVVAQKEFNRAVRRDMGIFLIAEAYGIEPYQVVRHKDGAGLLTEPYVVGKIADQIEASRGKNETEKRKTVKKANRKARRKRTMCSV